MLANACVTCGIRERNKAHPFELTRRPLCQPSLNNQHGQ